MPTKYDEDISLETAGKRAKYWLGMIGKPIENCDVSLFTMFTANVYSNAERANANGEITKADMQSLKESATYKVTDFIKNCECHKKSIHKK